MRKVPGVIKIINTDKYVNPLTVQAPPLPNMPQPVVQTAKAVNPNTNLTRTQEALLSPDRKSYCKHEDSIMPNGDKIRPKNTREHLLAIYGYITGLKKDVKHMHEGVHDLGGKIDKIYWVLLGTVGAVSLLLLEKVLDKGWF